MIKTEQKASETLSRIANLQQTQTELTDELNSKTVMLRNKYDERLKDISTKIQKEFESLTDWATQNRQENEKTRNLTSGKITWRKSTYLEVHDEEKVIQTLKRLKLGGLIKQTLAVKKNALINEPDLISKMKHVELCERETLTVTPTAGKALKKEIQNE
ncbi:MAG: host-nuclease inhibitor Gam family protein [Candidatus Parabeggiatoa sp.]|nr:host-nuclease inhibitor Gam family protein [Candidatus Parabeggiatoa sp.]